MISFIKYQIGSGDPNYPAVAFKRFENGTVQIYQYSRHSNRHGKTIYMTEKQFWEFISKANEIRKDEIICNECGAIGTHKHECVFRGQR